MRMCIDIPDLDPPIGKMQVPERDCGVLFCTAIAKARCSLAWGGWRGPRDPPPPRIENTWGLVLGSATHFGIGDLRPA